MFTQKYCLGIAIHWRGIDIAMHPSEHPKRTQDGKACISHLQVDFDSTTQNPATFYEYFAEKQHCYLKKLQEFVNQNNIRHNCCASSIPFENSDLFCIKLPNISLQSAANLVYTPAFQEKSFGQTFDDKHNWSIHPCYRGAEQTIFLCAAARKEIISFYTDFFSKSGLYLQHLTLSGLDVWPLICDKKAPSAYLFLDESPCLIFRTSQQQVGVEPLQLPCLICPRTSTPAYPKNNHQLWSDCVATLSSSPIMGQINSIDIVRTLPLRDAQTRSTVLEYAKIRFPAIRWSIKSNWSLPNAGAKPFKVFGRAFFLSHRKAYAPFLRFSQENSRFSGAEFIKKKRTSICHWVFSFILLAALYTMVATVHFNLQQQLSYSQKEHDQLQTSIAQNRQANTQYLNKKSILQYWQSIHAETNQTNQRLHPNHSLLEWLSRNTPPEIFFHSLQNKGNHYSLHGQGRSHRDVTNFYKIINQKTIFNELKLIDVQAQKQLNSKGKISFAMQGKAAE